MKVKKLTEGSNRLHIWNQLNKTKPLTFIEVIKSLQDKGLEMSFKNVPSVINQLVLAGWIKSKKIKNISYLTQSIPSKSPVQSENKITNLRQKILSYFRQNIGIIISRKKLVDDLNLKPKTSSISTYTIRFKELGLIEIDRIGNSTSYKALPAITNYAFNQHDSSALSIPSPLPTHSDIPALQSPRPIPTTIINADPLDIGTMVNKLMAVNQQNEMYKQGIQQIMLILEQMGAIESD